MRIRDLALGIYYGYPLCCVVQYVLDAKPRQAKRRGVIDTHRHNGSLKQWVPCHLHRQHPKWRPFANL